jgi:hypothetical protein
LASGADRPRIRRPPAARPGTATLRRSAIGLSGWRRKIARGAMERQRCMRRCRAAIRGVCVRRRARHGGSPPTRAADSGISFESQRTLTVW